MNILDARRCNYTVDNIIMYGVDNLYPQMIESIFNLSPITDSSKISMFFCSVNLPAEINFKEFLLSPDETKKFMIMGPITQEEVEGTDWDQLTDDLTL